MKILPVGLLACSLLLAGCGSLLPKPAPLPALHDFGLPVAGTPAPADVSITTTVTSPAWLDGSEIYYRLAYADATRVRAYADNRWLAPPAALLQARLQAVFGDIAPGAAGSSGAYRLSVRLLDLEQVFAGPQAASTRLRAVAELQDAASGAMLAQHVFSLRQAGAPDVGGAVQGASAAAEVLIADLVQWVRANAKTNTPASGQP